MKKKVLIIESVYNRDAFCAMVKIAREGGYDVEGILVGKNPCHDSGILCTEDPVDIIEFSRAFRPDAVFMEHDLGLGAHLTGRYFAHRLELPREILVGTSIHDQSYYCARAMHEKTRLNNHPLSADKFRVLLPVPA